MLTKDDVLREIRRIAAENGGVAPGRTAFLDATGIRESDWSGRWWTTWGAAVREAGFEPQRLNPRLDDGLVLAAEQLLPVDSTLIPTGERRPVAGTVFDFSKPTTIGARIGDTTDQQIRYGLGYDHCWVLTDPSYTLRRAAVLSEPSSGRRMEVWTTEPAIQFYSGNFLDGTVIGKGGVAYQFRSGLCLETQHYPDSPNRPDFPSATLNPGEKLFNTTVYRF